VTRPPDIDEDAHDRVKKFAMDMKDGDDISEAYEQIITHVLDEDGNDKHDIKLHGMELSV